MEIHRSEPERVAADIPRGNAQRPTKRDGEVRVIATNAFAQLPCFPCRGARISRSGSVDERRVHPAADFRHLFDATRDFSEEIPGRLREAVALTITTRQHV